MDDFKPIFTDIVVGKNFAQKDEEDKFNENDLSFGKYLREMR